MVRLAALNVFANDVTGNHQSIKKNAYKAHWVSKAEEEKRKQDLAEEARRSNEVAQRLYKKRMEEAEWLLGKKKVIHDHEMTDLLVDKQNAQGGGVETYEEIYNKKMTRKQRDFRNATLGVKKNDEHSKGGAKTGIRGLVSRFIGSSSADGGEKDTQISHTAGTFNNIKEAVVKRLIEREEKRKEKQHMEDTIEKVEFLRRAVYLLHHPRMPNHHCSAEEMDGYVDETNYELLDLLRLKNCKNNYSKYTVNTPAEVFQEELQRLEQELVDKFNNRTIRRTNAEVLQEDRDKRKFQVGGRYHHYRGAHRIYPLKIKPSTHQPLTAPGTETVLPEIALLPDFEKEKEARLAEERIREKENKPIRKLKKSVLNLSREQVFLPWTSLKPKERELMENTEDKRTIQERYQEIYGSGPIPILPHHPKIPENNEQIDQQDQQQLTLEMTQEMKSDPTILYPRTPIEDTTMLPMGLINGSPNPHYMIGSSRDPKEYILAAAGQANQRRPHTAPGTMQIQVGSHIYGTYGHSNAFVNDDNQGDNFYFVDEKTNQVVVVPHENNNTMTNNNIRIQRSPFRDITKPLLPWTADNMLNTTHNNSNNTNNDYYSVGDKNSILGEDLFSLSAMSTSIDPENNNNNNNNSVIGNISHDTQAPLHHAVRNPPQPRELTQTSKWLVTPTMVDQGVSKRFKYHRREFQSPTKDKNNNLNSTATNGGVGSSASIGEESFAAHSETRDSRFIQRFIGDRNKERNDKFDGEEENADMPTMKKNTSNKKSQNSSMLEKTHKTDAVSIASEDIIDKGEFHDDLKFHLHYLAQARVLTPNVQAIRERRKQQRQEHRGGGNGSSTRMLDHSAASTTHLRPHTADVSSKNMIHSSILPHEHSKSAPNTPKTNNPSSSHLLRPSTADIFIGTIKETANDEEESEGQTSFAENTMSSSRRIRVHMHGSHTKNKQRLQQEMRRGNMTTYSAIGTDVSTDASTGIPDEEASGGVSVASSVPSVPSYVSTNIDSNASVHEELQSEATASDCGVRSAYYSEGSMRPEILIPLKFERNRTVKKLNNMKLKHNLDLVSKHTKEKRYRDKEAARREKEILAEGMMKSLGKTSGGYSMN